MSDKVMAIASASAADDGQRLIRRPNKKRLNQSRRPRFAISSRIRVLGYRKRRNANKESSSTSAAEQQAQQEQSKPTTWDPFEKKQKSSCHRNSADVANNPKKKRIPYRLMRSAGKRINRIFRKGAKYLGIAIIKVFNQPGIYTEDSRICVC